MNYNNSPDPATSTALHGGVERLSGVDGLRAVAMTMVIAQHCGLLPFGWVGVWLFFVISGYVITRGFLLEESPGRVRQPVNQRFASFVRRRVLRIVPVYALYVAVCALFFALPYGFPALIDLLGLTTFTYNWQMILLAATETVHWPAIGHLWTLSVEQQFYILYPLLFLCAPTQWRWRVAGAVVVLAPVTRWLWISFVGVVVPDADAGRLAFSVYASTVCQIDSFLLGALLARFQAQLLGSRKLPARLMLLALVIVLFFAAAYIALNYARGDRGVGMLKNIYSGIVYGQARELFVYSVINLVAAAVLLVTIAGTGGTVWLSNRLLAWVGRVSFGGYLFHALLLWGVSDWIGQELKHTPISWRIVGFVTIFFATVGLASLSFTYFEQPVARRFKAWTSRRTTPDNTNEPARV